MFSGFYDNRGLRGSLIVSCFSLELITDVALCNDQVNQVDEFKRRRKKKKSEDPVKNFHPVRDSSSEAVPDGGVKD